MVILSVPSPRVVNILCSILKNTTLIKKKIKFSSYIRKFRVEQLQSHIRYEEGLPNI
jgi:hypothetical protein